MTKKHGRAGYPELDFFDVAIQKALEQDACLREVRMPKQIDKKELAEFVEQLKEFMAVNDFSQAKLSKRLNINRSVVSQFINGQYPGDVAKLMQKLASFMDTFQRRNRRDKGPGFVNTTVAKKIFAMIKQTESCSNELEGRIGLLVGDSGHGKSICLRQYCKANRNSAYIQLNDTMSSTAVFAAIAKTLRDGGHARIDDTGGLKKLTDRLIAKLENREFTIILDEASALDVRKLNQLRQVITVSCKCPLIISGNSHLLKTIQDDAGRRGFESLDQFRSRLVAVINLDELAAANRKDSGGKLYTAEDIRKLYEYSGVKLTRDAISTLTRICRTPLTGRLRTCSIIIEALHLSPQVKRKIAKGEQLDSKFIISAIYQLGLPVLDRLPVVGIREDEEQGQQQISKAG